MPDMPWVLVPRYATKAMADAAYKAHDEFEAATESAGWGGVYSLYDAMVAASPTSAPNMCRDGHEEVRHASDGERCPVCLERDRARELWIVLEQAIEAMEAVSDFVTTGEKIQQPDGHDFWLGEMQHVRDALERHRSGLITEDE